MSVFNWIFFLSVKCCNPDKTWPMTTVMSIGSRKNLTAPDSIRDISRRPSIKFFNKSDSSSMIAKNSCLTRSGIFGSRSIVAVYALMEVKGVRNSCETDETKSDFILSISRSRATSRRTITTPITVPSSLRIGAAVAATGRCPPSFATRTSRSAPLSVLPKLSTLSMGFSTAFFVFSSIM